MPSTRQDTKPIDGRQPAGLKKPTVSGSSRRQALLPALALAPFCALASINHLFELWERSRMVQAALFTAFTLAWLALLILLLGWLIPVLRRLNPGRSALAVLASLVVSAFILVQLPPGLIPHPPSTHELRIYVPEALDTRSAGEVRVLEFIGPDEIKQPLHLFEQRGIWVTDADGSLTHTSSKAGELFFTFYGKWNQPVELLFQASPQAGKAEVILDGRRQMIDLRDSYPNNRIVSLTTGSTRPLWNILLPAADLAVLFVLALAITAILILLSKKPALTPLLNAREGLPALLLYLLSAGLGSAYIQQVRFTNLVDVRPIEYSNLVFGLVFGLVILAAYAVMRLGSNRLWSFLGAVGFATSPLHLYALTMLHREYIRALFTLAALFFTGLILLGKNTPRRLYLLSALTGAMIGWGLHYRQDLLLYFVPYLVLVLFFLPGFKGRDIAIKLSAVGLCLVMVYAAQFLAGGAFHLEGTSVAAIGGLMEPLTHKMAIQDPIYNLGSIWVMEYADSVPILHRDLLGASTNYIQAGILTFPADILLRAYASVVQVLDLPFLFVLPPLGVDSPLVNAFYQVRAALLGFPPGAGAVLAALTLLVIAAKDLRKALFYAFVTVFLCAYPAVDFQARHFFQLQMFTWFNLGFLLYRLVRVVRSFLAAPRKDGRSLRQSLECSVQQCKALPLRLGAFTLGGLAVLLLPLMLARGLQTNTVTEMLQRYEAASRQEIPLTLQPLENGYVLWTNPQVFVKPPSTGVTYGKLLAVEFDPARCSFTTLWPRVTYNFDTASIRGTRQELSYETQIDLDPAKGKVTYTFQAIFANASAGWQGHPGYSHFAGIRLPAEASACLTGIAAIDPPAENPILVNALLFDGWQETPLYQRSLLLEGGKTDESSSANRIVPIQPEQVAFTGYPLEFGIKGQWLVDGYTIPAQGTAAMEKISPYSVYAVLLETQPIQLKPGDEFTASGQVYAGGVLFELLQDGTVHDRFLVTGPVPFNVRLAAQQEGAYTLRMSAHIDKFSSYETRLKVESPAWLVE